MSTSMLRACVIESSHRAHHFSRKTEYSKLWKLGISLCRCGMQGLVLKSQAPQVLDAGGGQVWLRSHRGEYLGIYETSPQPSTLVPGNPFLREEGSYCAKTSQGPLQCTAVFSVFAWQGASHIHPRLPPNEA